MSVLDDVREEGLADELIPRRGDLVEQVLSRRREAEEDGQHDHEAQEDHQGAREEDLANDDEEERLVEEKVRLVDEGHGVREDGDANDRQQVDDEEGEVEGVVEEAFANETASPSCP